MKLAVTGFVSEQAGSGTSGVALLLRELLRRGHEITFFSKSSFVDPRPSLGGEPGFRFVETTNAFQDGIRRKLQHLPLLGMLAGQWDTISYNRLLLKKMAGAAKSLGRFDLCLWLLDYAWGRTAGVPSVSFVQGPPGTDARSILHRIGEVKALAGPIESAKWQTLAKFRLSRLGLPPFGNSDHFIVGSSESQGALHNRYGIPADRVSTLPFPIDLELFDLGDSKRQTVSGHDARDQPLRLCWLGRIVPRKRLDLFLNGAALAIRQGVDLQITIVGGVGFVPGYEKLIQAFPFANRLQWEKSVARQQVPALLYRQDVLVQPSDEENFGSSVAEAQACGLPVIVGRTNGNADYLCSRDIHLSDDRPETLAAALRELSLRKTEGRWGDPGESRRCAEEHFSLERVTTRLIEILESVIAPRGG